MSTPSIRFTNFEDRGGVAARFEVIAEGRKFSAHVTVCGESPVGLHVCEGVEYDGPTTGDDKLDSRICELAVDEVRRARAARHLTEIEKPRLAA